MPFLSSTLALSVLLAVHALRTDGEVDGSTVWLTVCTPPACSTASPLLNNTRQTSGLPVVVLEQLRGRAVSMQGLQRTRKLHMIREYLLSEEGRRWHTVVYADALDVIAGTGSETALRAILRRLGAVDDGQLVASAEPACSSTKYSYTMVYNTSTRTPSLHY